MRKIEQAISDSLKKACYYYWKHKSSQEALLIFHEKNTYYLCGRNERELDDVSLDDINIKLSTNPLDLIKVAAKTSKIVRLIETKNDSGIHAIPSCEPLYCFAC